MGKTTLTWEYDGLVGEGFKVYRADSPMDPENLPLPIATVGIEARAYEDETVVDNETYYYRIASYVGGTERLSEEIEHIAKKSGDPYWDNVVALLHFDDPNDAVKTEKGAAWYVHAAGSGFGEVTQDAAKFGVAGLKLNSPNRKNYYFPAINGVILTGEIFTAEVFCMPRKLSPHVFTSFFGAGDSDQQLVFNANGKIWFYRGTNALGGRLEGVGVNQYALNTYYHIAMTFDGTHIRVFVDGNKEIEVATTLGWTGNSNTRFGLGDTDIGSYNNSYRPATDVCFDELRITKGVARYTENFTPPTEPFPNFGN